MGEGANGWLGSTFWEDCYRGLPTCMKLAEPKCWFKVRKADKKLLFFDKYRFYFEIIVNNSFGVQ